MRSNPDTHSNPDGVLVEVLTASDCGRCQKTKTLAKEVIAELNDSRVCYREINVVQDIDYAVQLGVMSTPAIALNGELVFASPPSRAKLCQAILQQLGRSSIEQGKAH